MREKGRKMERKKERGGKLDDGAASLKSAAVGGTRRCKQHKECQGRARERQKGCTRNATRLTETHSCIYDHEGKTGRVRGPKKHPGKHLRHVTLSPHFEVYSKIPVSDFPFLNSFQVYYNAGISEGSTVTPYRGSQTFPLF